MLYILLLIFIYDSIILRDNMKKKKIDKKC